MTTYSFVDESGETRLRGTIDPAPGGTSAVQASTPVTLTDAQVKALPTTAITLIAAPGASKMIVPLAAYLTADFATAYGGIDAAADGPSLWVGAASSPAFLASFSDDTTPVTTLTLLLTGTNEFGAVFWTMPPSLQVLGGISVPTGNGGPSDWANLPFKIGSTNSIHFTGGNAANTLTVNVLYTVVDV